MNRRLVELVAQTILAMSVEERQLLERQLKKGIAPASQDEEFGELDKSSRIAEIAEDIRSFEETYNSPLTQLSPDDWGADGGPQAVANDGANERLSAATPKNGGLSMSSQASPSSSHGTGAPHNATQSAAQGASESAVESNGTFADRGRDEQGEASLLSLLSLPTTLSAEPTENWSSRLESMG